MKIVIALLLIACIFLGCTYANATTEEVQEMVNEGETSSHSADSSLSILDAVKYVKSQKFARSLAGVDETTVGDLSPTQIKQSYYQFCIWVPIMLFLIMFYGVMAIFYMDVNKDQDTLIYAKFITSYK